MKLFKTYTLRLFAALIIIGFSLQINGQNYTYNDSWFEHGFNLEASSGQHVEVSYSIKEFNLSNIQIDREGMQLILLPGHFLPNDEGKPNLPGKGRYIAIPKGAQPILKIIETRTELVKDINIAPSPNIPLDTDKNPLRYVKDEAIYSQNAFFPAEPLIISEVKQIRGVDVVMLGITPFQYNPVTKELLVYRDLKIEITFEGGNGQFGEDRLRSKWFDPLLSDAILNFQSLPEIDYHARTLNASRELNQCEYLIITPNDDIFQQWADSIKTFRIKQGIQTEIITVAGIGGNSPTTIEDFIDSIYAAWSTPPAAILILGDYGFSGDNSVTAPIWDSYCASDNIYADVDNDDLPDIVLARMTAQTAAHLETMVTKFLDYERNPPASPDFYNHPITALGWQTERWFQICSETVGGYFKYIQGKDPVRINEIYAGNPNTDPWSTYSNTPVIMDFFGPDGLEYIPAEPSELGGWSGGNANDINNAINNGAFILQHRDHGGTSGWGEPAYSSNNINGLTNTDLTFVMSINCLTGKYNMSGECFTEKFHRYTYNNENSGALGLIAASEVSYSFVNDTYVWGFYDNLWPDFMPAYGSTPEPRGLLPAFGNAAAKYFLESSSWPANNSIKPVTYHLFHHHGDAFMTLYSEVPQDLTVAHNAILIGGATSFTVTSDEGSFIALTVNGEIIATADGTGGPVVIPIEPQAPGNTMIVTITKTNYYRYEAEVEVISPSGPYCLYEWDTIADENQNGILEYAENSYYTVEVKNYGNDDANNVDVTISTDDEYITLIDSVENYGLIPAGQSVSVDSGFYIEIANDIPDNYAVIFNVESTDGNETWYSNYISSFFSPILEITDCTVLDNDGNNNGRIDPGETVELVITVANIGGAEAYNAVGDLQNTDTYIEIITNGLSYGNIVAGGTAVQSFTIYASDETPGGHLTQFGFELMADHDISVSGEYEFTIGQYPALVIDMDPNQRSGPAIQTAIETYGLNVAYETDFPASDEMIIYESVFVCLGAFYSSWELTHAESAILVKYLEDGGNLYMEGLPTWYNDIQRQIHGKFNIDVISDGWYAINNEYGVSGTFTADMMFEYDAITPNINYYFEAEAPAFVIFTSDDENSGNAVAYDNTDNYKTIGASFEFGFLIDAEHPSTKQELMRQYLIFFGILDPYVGIDDFAASNGEVNVYPNPFNEIVTFEFVLDNNSDILLEVFDIQGRRVSTIAKENLESGVHTINWNGTDADGGNLQQGVYFYTLNTDDKVFSGKLTILK